MGILESSAGVTLRLFNEPNLPPSPTYDPGEHFRWRYRSRAGKCPRLQAKTKARSALKRKKREHQEKQISVILGRYSQPTRERFYKLRMTHSLWYAAHSIFNRFELRHLGL